jgi:hypothetical protein
VNPVATLVSNNGTTATYNVSSGGTEWALFNTNGNARVAGAVGSSGSFSVPVPGTYTLFAVYGTPGSGQRQGLGQTTLTVVAPMTYFTITASAGSNGSISHAGAFSAAKGSNVTYTFTPASGYHIEAVTVDGKLVGGVPSYTFTNVQAAHTISVTFGQGPVSTYVINSSAGDNGSISLAGDLRVTAGATVNYTMQPATGYCVATITVDGVALPTTAVAGSFTASSPWYQFLNVVMPHTISVTFKPNKVGWFTVSPLAGDNGEIWMAQQTVQASSTLVACSVIPHAGYHVASLTVDGVLVTPSTWYIFYNVQDNHTIAATFAADPLHFNIVASAGLHGHISMAGSVPCTQGTDVTYTFTPDSGYYIAGLTVDGSTVPTDTSYTFANVQVAHTIAVSFAAIVVPPVGPTATTLSFTTTSVSLKRGQYVGCSSVLSGGVPAGTLVRYEVKKPGSKVYVLLYTRAVNSAGASSYRYKTTVRGTYYFRARFLGTASFTASTSSGRTVRVK